MECSCVDKNDPSRGIPVPLHWQNGLSSTKNPHVSQVNTFYRKSPWKSRHSVEFPHQTATRPIPPVSCLECWKISWWGNIRTPFWWGLVLQEGAKNIGLQTAASFEIRLVLGQAISQTTEATFISQQKRFSQSDNMWNRALFIANTCLKAVLAVVFEIVSASDYLDVWNLCIYCQVVGGLTGDESILRSRCDLERGK